MATQPLPPLTSRLPDVSRMGSTAGVRSNMGSTGGFSNGGHMSARGGGQFSARGDGMMRNPAAMLDISAMSRDYAEVQKSYAQTSISKFDQDATNHWTKWGSGGWRMAQELKIVADELYSLCAGEAGQWFPDMRMHRIHEKIIHMVDGLSRQGGPPLDNSGDNLPLIHAQPPRTPPSVTKIENARLRKKLADTKMQVDAMENTFVVIAKQRETVKAREAWFQKYGLKGRFFAYDTSGACRCLSAWAKHVFSMLKARRARELVAEWIDWAECELDWGLKAKCMGVWSTIPIVSSNRRRVVRILGEWFERGRGGALEQQLVLYFTLWSPYGRMRALQRTIDSANQRISDMQEKFRQHIDKIMDRFGNTIMGQVEKMIGMDEWLCSKSAFQSWTEAVKLENVGRKKRQEAEEAERLAQQRRLIAAERIFGKSKRGLFIYFFGVWREAVEEEKRRKAQMEAGMSAAMLRFFGSQGALQKDCMSGWAGAIRADRVARAKAEMEAGRRLVAEARARAMKLFDNKKGKPPEQLLIPCMDEWVDMVEDQKRRRLGKESAMAMVLSSIRHKDFSLLSMSIGSWATMVALEKAFAKDRDLWALLARERSFHLAHKTVMRLHKRLAVTHVFEAWVQRSSL